MILELELGGGNELTYRAGMLHSSESLETTAVEGEDRGAGGLQGDYHLWGYKGPDRG